MSLNDIITMDGGALTSATLFARDCSFPITDLMRLMPEDQVLQNIPIAIGEWEDSTKQPAILSYQNTILTDITDDTCRAPIVSTQMTECELTAPDQETIKMETTEMVTKDLIAKVCRMRNVSPDKVGGNLFNPDKTLNLTGNPYALDFARLALDGLKTAFMQQVSDAVLDGDNANPLECDGIYTQVDAGWTDSVSNACGAAVNVGQTIDWGALCDAATASPDDVTASGKTVTWWGTAFDVPEGLNFSQFVEEFVLEAIRINWGGRLMVDQFEFHVPFGKGRAFAKNAACLQPCNISGEFDPELRERFANYVNARIVQLFPNPTFIPILETHKVTGNTMRIVPRTVNGRPTYGIVFRNIANVLAETGALNDTYGQHWGNIPVDDPLTPELMDMLELDFEELILYWDVTKLTASCVVATMMCELGTLAMNRNLWFKVSNITSPAPVMTKPTTLVIDTSA